MAISSFVMVCVVFPPHTQDNRLPEIFFSFFCLFLFGWWIFSTGICFFEAILGRYSFFKSIFHEFSTKEVFRTKEGTIQNSSVASVNTPCCSVITTHVEKVSCDEPRPGSSKDLEESRSLLPKPQSTFTIQNRYYYSVSFFKVPYRIKFLKVV